MKILLIEDEKRMAEALCELLKQEGYICDICESGDEGLLALESGIYDVAVVDVMLPVMNGFDIVRNARKAGIRTAVLMLTAKSDTDDKVAGLDSGADDYLTKPFSTRELLARIRALGRRSLGAVDGSLAYGDVVLETGSLNLTCTATGQSVRLSDREYRILEYMLSNSGRILTREQLAVKIWGYESDAQYNNVEVYMSFTRRKLSFIGSQTMIKSVRGVGYELRYGNVQKD